MKKTICTLATVACMIFSINANAATMYAPDGRTAEVSDVDVEAWKAVGWYTQPFITVYAPDGRTTVIPKNNFDLWHAVGWYSEPVMYVYALDGRVQLIAKSQFDAYHSVGWYSKPVSTVFAPDGRTQVVPTEDVRAWQNVGWDYYMTMYSNDGKTTKKVPSKDYYKYWGENYSPLELTTQSDSLDMIQYSPNGTNISLEQAFAIAKEYADKHNYYDQDTINFYLNEWKVYDFYERLHQPSILDYSPTAYLIDVDCIDYVEFYSVNKTTGYVFYAGGGQDYWRGMCEF